MSTLTTHSVTAPSRDRWGLTWLDIYIPSRCGAWTVSPRARLAWLLDRMGCGHGEARP